MWKTIGIFHDLHRIDGRGELGVLGGVMASFVLVYFLCIRIFWFGFGYWLMDICGHFPTCLRSSKLTRRLCRTILLLRREVVERWWRSV